MCSLSTEALTESHGWHLWAHRWEWERDEIENRPHFFSSSSFDVFTCISFPFFHINFATETSWWIAASVLWIVKTLSTYSWSERDRNTEGKRERRGKRYLIKHSNNERIHLQRPFKIERDTKVSHKTITKFTIKNEQSGIKLKKENPNATRIRNQCIPKGHSSAQIKQIVAHFIHKTIEMHKWIKEQQQRRQ